MKELRTEKLYKDRKGAFHVKPAAKKVYKRTGVYGIVERNNKILFVKPMWKNKLDLPGGGVRKGKKIFDELKREFLEETGFFISASSQQAIAIKKEPFYDDENDVYYDSTMLFFLVDITGKQDISRIERNEIRETVWCNISNLDNAMINKIHRDVVRIIKNNSGR